MKKILYPVLLLLILTPKLNAQSSDTTLDVVSWNMEWFGASFENPANDDLQRENAKKIIRYLNADIYGLVEMVDTAQIRRLADSLGSDYAYILSDFCSNATAPGTGAWRNGQKLMFLYKKNIFSNVKTRGLLRTSATANTNWATGRFPFLLNADATIDGITKNINFIVIHGKSGSAVDDYNRRKAGAKELKDTLDAQFPNSINIIFGDFNDALNMTISTGAGSESSYQPIIADSTDANHYKSITMPLALAGQATMIDYPNVIDNHVISNEMEAFYVTNSVKIRTDITSIVPDYISAHNTSDHWPVFSKYSLAGNINDPGPPPVDPNPTTSEISIVACPNPVVGLLNIQANNPLTNVQLRLINSIGQTIGIESVSALAAGVCTPTSLYTLSKGVYFLQVEAKETKTVIKLLVQ